MDSAVRFTDPLPYQSVEYYPLARRRGFYRDHLIEQSYRCFYCDLPMLPDIPEVRVLLRRRSFYDSSEHIWPRRYGFNQRIVSALGRHRIVPACDYCNSLRGRVIDEDTRRGIDFRPLLGKNIMAFEQHRNHTRALPQSLRLVLFWPQVPLKWYNAVNTRRSQLHDIFAKLANPDHRTKFMY